MTNNNVTLGSTQKGSRSRVSVFVYTPNPDDNTDSGRLFGQVIEHLQSKWPGTLLLAACSRIPKQVGPSRSLDWVRLDDDQSGSDLAGFLGEMFRVRAFVFIGPESTGFLNSIDSDHLCPRILLSQETVAPGNHQAEHTLTTNQLSDWRQTLDDLFIESVPVELFCGPDNLAAEVVNMLRRHPHGNRARQVVVNWAGAADERLGRVLAALSEASQATFLADLFLSEMFDVPRGWLTPSVADVFLHPKAWQQLGSFVRLLLSAPRRVDFSVSSDSPRAWVRAGVQAVNSSLALFRRGVK